MHTSRLASERQMAARQYRELFSGVDSVEADAAAMRLQTMVEGINGFMQALSQRSGSGPRGRR